MLGYDYARTGLCVPRVIECIYIIQILLNLIYAPELVHPLLGAAYIHA